MFSATGLSGAMGLVNEKVAAKVIANAKAKRRERMMNPLCFGRLATRRTASRLPPQMVTCRRAPPSLS